MIMNGGGRGPTCGIVLLLRRKLAPEINQHDELATADVVANELNLVDSLALDALRQ